MSNTDYIFRQAGPEEAAAVTELINEAFKVELQFFSKDRIDLSGVREHMEKGTFIVAERDGKLVGCVYTELRDEKGYFGLLSVAPSEQGRGLGARLITESEDLCREAGRRIMYLNTVNLRPELPPFYEKFGYAVVREDFPEQDPSALQPYHFVVMEKVIGE
jgi:predicted N-acetyltransferase YhbS